jgi:hypothetical protein
MSRIALERLCLVLVAVMTAEVGYLWRAYTAPVKREVVVVQPVTAAPEPEPLVALAPAQTPAVAPQANATPPAATLPPRRERPGQATPTAASRPDAVDCARSGDPLCGLPAR